MALSSLGRQVAIAENMPTVHASGSDVREVTDAANAQLTQTRLALKGRQQAGWLVVS